MRNCELEEIPKEIEELHSLEELNLYTNNIRDVSNSSEFLNKLKKLDLRKNPIEFQKIKD